MKTGGTILRQVFAANVRRRRSELRLSQEELADLAGIHRTYLSTVERAQRNVSIDNIERLAAALKVPAAVLLTEAL